MSLLLTPSIDQFHTVAKPRAIGSNFGSANRPAEVSKDKAEIMAGKLIVKDQVEIHTPRDQVWEVLTNPELIKQWDDIPGELFW